MIIESWRERQMFIAVNKIQVPAAHRQAAIEGFEKAMPGMKGFKGFLGLELWTSEDNTLLAVSRWESKEALDEYVNNELYRQHHGESGGGRAGGSDVTTYYEAKVLG
jgi:heme-degrading monooxygenase HmoA